MMPQTFLHNWRKDWADMPQKWMVLKIDERLTQPSGSSCAGEGLKGAWDGLGNPITEKPPSQLALGTHPSAACC